MTEPNPVPDCDAVTNLEAVTEDKSAKTKKPWVAGILSLVFPGLGQLYAGRPRRGLAISLTLSVITLLVLFIRLLQQPIGLLVWVVAGVLVRVAVVTDAVLSARQNKHAQTIRNKSQIAYFAAATIIVAACIFPTSDQLLARSKGFKVPTASMCPTICENERVIADMAAYKKDAPGRGDLIMLQTKFGKSLFIKRVIATGGDTVTQGRQGEVLVNGNPLPPVSICSAPKMRGESEGTTIEFCPVKVPSGSFFVVGDNLNNSLDSRIPDFGLVTLNQIQGKPLYLYWSPVLSRIGCKTR